MPTIVLSLTCFLSRKMIKYNYRKKTEVIAKNRDWCYKKYLSCHYLLYICPNKQRSNGSSAASRDDQFCENALQGILKTAAYLEAGNFPHRILPVLPFTTVRPKKRLNMFDYSRQNLQLNYVRMSEEFKVLDLPADFSYNIKAADLLSIQNLHCNFMASQLMFANCNEQGRIQSGFSNAL